MKLDRVTITGPDDSVSPVDIISLSRKFPFVEWGILASSARIGTARFPSFMWIGELQSAALNHSSPVNLSLHLCGKWVRELLVGEIAFPLSILDVFQRIQLNFHAENTQCNPEALHGALASLASVHKRQFIFQIDGNGGNQHLQSLHELGAEPSIDTAPLFDISGGAGILPNEWPKPYFMQDGESFSYHGYAGGLGPENLAEQIPRIAEAAGDTRIWIDMETRVRSDNDRKFDLAKVRRCLEIAAPFVRSEAAAV